MHKFTGKNHVFFPSPLEGVGAIALLLTGGIVVSIIRASRTPASQQVEIPARRKLIPR
jgi:hypothetical protein